MKRAGVYKIENISNGKIYIGKTINIKNRLLSHIYNSKRINTNLYNDMYCFGLNNFNVDILYECEYYRGVNPKLECLETKYIIKYNSVNNGYNKNYGNINNVCKYKNYTKGYLLNIIDKFCNKK